jgi:hypothetical protein
MRKPFIAVAFLGAVIAQGMNAATNCDRACLVSIMTQYLNAMVKHDPKAAPIASNVRFTEDTVDMKIGDGLWKGASKIRDYRQDYIDVAKGVAASHVIVEEDGNPVLLAIRLGVVDRKITEIETQVTHNKTEGALLVMDNLQTPTAAMATPPEKSQLMPREAMVDAAMHYPAGLKIGSFAKVDAPFAPDTYRLENGAKMAGKGCSRAGCEDIKGQKIMEHLGITTRVIAVDEANGTVLLRMNFGQTNSYGPGNALQAWEAFKVYGGQIHAVEAFMKVMPETVGDGGWK